MADGKAATLFALASTAATLVVAAPASAATATWTCAGSAVRATVAGGEPVDPIRTDRAPCQTSATGLPKTTEAVGLAPAIKAETAYALTGAAPAGGKPMNQAINASAGVEGLSVNSGSNVVIGVDAARSTATAACANGQPVVNGTSETTGLTINGTKVSLDSTLSALLDPVSNSPLGAIVQVRLNEQTKDGGQLVQRAAHVIVLSALGATPLADVVIAESRVASADACDPNADGNGDLAGGGTATGQVLGQVCPKGATLDVARSVCIIPASASGGAGTIVVGPPYSGPSGGTVVSLPLARKRYTSPCLSGNAAPRYVVVGTKGKDRITGTNRRDRILGLGGNDSLDAGRSVDCVDGGTGNDRMSGGIGSDRLYGSKGRDTILGGADKDRIFAGPGNDALNGGPGADLLSAGTGNDTINAGFGADRVLGGPGRDFINIATQGPKATVDCGTGPDKVRLNKKEVRGLRGCETRYVFNDR